MNILLENPDGVHYPDLDINIRGAEMKVTHLVSPLLKPPKEVPHGLGSRKTPAGLAHTQYHQKIRTSENSTKLKEIVKSIIGDK